ncbi:hypothetical protein [Flavobacterium subsaxonicum]|uniref:Uncharacterized protein n=1 Tax=Flavobacterium subsaxonicum WB 4.1-42 = DSM 21790 TaxID=1121898 RepID=A0A0A2N3Y3_9FLAO|nr:hypothetical protein [Flavobacterium subsaxonicum]KGO95145.1 hypothetical protein Q766_03350 [Flavobacterium subsaxonicum WB 4.1-42 = DSM 21790]
MDYLVKFTPAEALMVVKGPDVPLKDLLKATFIDLLVKQVLQVFEVEKFISSRDSIWVYKYVKEGTNFKTYKPNEHEQFFLQPFKTSGDALLLRNFVKIAYQNCKGERAFKNLLHNNYNLKPLFTKTLIQLVFGGLTINSLGLKTQAVLQSEIVNLQAKLLPMLQSANAGAAAILLAINGNIVLLQDADDDFFNLIDKELLLAMSQQRGYDFDFAPDEWPDFDFDGISDSFNSSCGGHSGCGGHGCGGDGCSGCGGCGGD